jgi:hypothetical protein
MGDNMFHTGPSPARFAGGLSHFVGEAVWPLRGQGDGRRRGGCAGRGYGPECSV